MPGLAKVIVLDPDARAGQQIQLGFRREAVETVLLPVPATVEQLELEAAIADDAGVVLVGGDGEAALALLRRVRGLLDEARIDVPLVFTGRGVKRRAATEAGADEVIAPPAFLRDVVTIARLLRQVTARDRAQLAGSLGQTSGVLTLVRAFAALGRSGVLTLMRGLRRGEVRFYEGEVTSAQVGLIHGQAALHQLLLWTDARFDFRQEEIVRRQQIPLAHDELLADAERFLTGVREASGTLVPSIVLEQDVMRVQSLGKQIPTEVHGVLRMFDGHRMLADVLEDSPYRVFETLRVAQRAVDAGLLRATSQQKQKATWRAVLAIEEWLVSNEPPRPSVPHESAAAAKASRESAPSIPGTRKRRQRQTLAPLAPPPSADIDWGQLVPRSVGQEPGPVAGVVPSEQRSGEISVPTRDAPRERLEALMDTGKREKIFPTDIGLEPKVVFEEVRPRTATDEAAELAERLGVAAKQRDADAAKLRKQRKDDDAAAKAKAKAQADADARARRIAKQKTDAEAQAKRDVEAKAQAQAEAKAKADAKARAVAEAEARKRAALEIEIAERAARDAAAKAEAERIADEVRIEHERAARAAKERAASESDVAPARTRKAPTTRAEDLVKRLVADEPRVLTTPPVTVSEKGGTTVSLRDEVTVTETERGAELVAMPVATIEEDNPLIAKPIRPASSTAIGIAKSPTPIAVPVVPVIVEPPAPPIVAEPPPPAPVVAEIADEPSDGVVAPIVGERTPTLPPPPPIVVPEDDRPEAKTGEIASAPVEAPMFLAADEASILVADIATAGAAVAAVAAAQVDAPPTADARSEPREAEVATVRKDATGAFTSVEEDFFREGAELSKAHAKVSPDEVFDDLDRGYQPAGFWDRLRGKKKK